MIEHTNGVSGQIILDSISPEDIRLTTLHMRYPRMVHSELMTHRVFSRNGRSSRAVPVATLLKEGHYTPHFLKNKPGMIATEELNPLEMVEAKIIWEILVKQTRHAVEELNRIGVHKQWANRPLEWFGYIDVLISSTDWANFMALRDDEAAQPEIKSVAELIKQLMDDSILQNVEPGQWHLPYINWVEDYKSVISYIEKNKVTCDMCPPSKEAVLSLLRKISTARCARLSIKPFDGDGSIEKELARYEKLVVSRPVHASPAEHIATPDTRKYWAGSKEFAHKHENRNFRGWRQYRAMIPDNTVND